MNHRGFNSMRDEFIKRKITYYGINNDIKSVINKCDICSLKKTTEIQKRERTKLIIFNRPRVRYIGDLTDIPFELSTNTNYKYIFTLIDHFSKFSASYLLINKKKNQFLIH